MNAASGETIDLTVLEEDLLNNNEPNNNDGQPAGKQTLKNRFVSEGPCTVCSVANSDPVSGAFLTPGGGIRDPGWVKCQDLVPG